MKTEIIYIIGVYFAIVSFHYAHRYKFHGKIESWEYWLIPIVALASWIGVFVMAFRHLLDRRNLL